MKNFRFVSLVIALSTSFLVNGAGSQESKFVLGIALGSSSVNIDQNKIQTDVDFDDDGFGATYLVAYRWGNNLVAEANLSHATNNFLFEGFDFYKTTELKLMLGYSFQLAQYLRIVPMLGVSKWDLDSQEGLVFNSGPEQRVEFDGTDLTYKLSLELPINDSFSLSLSYAKSHLDLGTSELSLVGLKFEF